MFWGWNWLTRLTPCRYCNSPKYWVNMYVNSLHVTCVVQTLRLTTCNTNELLTSSYTAIPSVMLQFHLLLIFQYVMNIDNLYITHIRFNKVTSRSWCIFQPINYTKMVVFLKMQFYLNLPCWVFFFSFNTVIFIILLVSITSPFSKAFPHVETLFVQGRNLYLASLLLVGGK